MKQHGEDAAIIAAQRANALLAEGDVEGQRMFKEIVKAINELQRGKPGEDEQRH
jgi:DNA-directed RNA polymerase subunit K/omega